MKIFAENYSLPRMGWLAAQMAQPGRIVAQDAIYRVPTIPALKITVQPGDCPIPGLTTERNEYLWMLNANNNDVNGNTGLDHWATSFCPDMSWQDVSDNWQDTALWCCVLQLHGPNTMPQNQGSPTFEVDIMGGRYVLKTRGGATTGVVRKVIDLGAYTKGIWTDFLFKILWGIDNSAFIQVYRRDNKIGDLEAVGSPIYAPNLYSTGGAAQPGYGKAGIYRNQSKLTQTLYRSRLVRASTFEEAAYYAFCA